MLRLMRDYLTIDQLADRWGLDWMDVHQLILTRRLPQAFLLSGPADIVRIDSAGSRSSHPLTAQGVAQTRLLVSTKYTVGDIHVWPLHKVSHVYEFVVAGTNNPGLLKQVCKNECAKAAGWALRFQEQATGVIGQNSFQISRDACRDAVLVTLSAVLAFENDHQITPRSSADQQESGTFRDARKPSCRAIAQILWERDPAATIPDLFRSEWVQRVACGGKPPTEKTFREWIKDLNPDRSPGRRAA